MRVTAKITSILLSRVEIFKNKINNTNVTIGTLTIPIHEDKGMSASSLLVII